ncbi:aminoglycoside phosphotransferase [Bifidobacterium animalis subsp. animalis MCC 0499]|uniref:phosphotransferase n=1 Tax=Bifidobacterium animalis TaxID=28025 RepID=UPI00069AA7D2|nr:phosphotransferase [Bifidobacterium animalis]KOA62095.1 aminoglycoside phosphotransferase [Bifidobacterium animalis subsp. animalis MCC 0499]
MPNVSVAGVRDSEQDNDTDRAVGIEQAVVQDMRGRLFNVYAAYDPRGKKRLHARGRAAAVVDRSREFAGLGFGTEHVLAFHAGKDGPEDAAVLITTHPDGVARSLELLTIDDCSSFGTALGAIHRLRPNFITDAHYPVFTTGQIHAQLTAWIKRLRQAGHVPQEITSRWGAIMETEGLWSFSTRPVHGGFSDGDLIYSGSSITAITNWQDMQINDPARDLAWVFAKLDETHRNAVITAYGRVLGNRLDDLIMLRANLWVQMEQVGDFIKALNAGDNDRIMEFKAQVDRLAHKLGVSARAAHTARPTSGAAAAPGNAPSTVTVNTLLREDPRTAAPTNASGFPDDSTNETDVTGSRSYSQVVDDRTNSHPVAAVDDSTNDSPVLSSETVIIGINDSSSRGTQIVREEDFHYADDDTIGDRTDSTASPVAASRSDAETTVIPLLEREERAMRDARAGLEGTQGPDSQTGTQAVSADGSSDALDRTNG